MYALITGASSGIGKDISILLAKKGYDLILVARREERLLNLAKEIEALNQNAKVIPMDISILENIDYLYDETKNYDIEVLVNNAGFGELNFFEKSKEDIAIIDVNVRSMHYLFKKYYELFSSKKRGYILNVASMASFMPGPKMATYYASKAYVLSLTNSVSYEAKKSKNNVIVSALCPGPVDTEFNLVAHVNFGSPSISSMKCAKIAVKGLFKGKRIIIPGVFYKLSRFFSRFIPLCLLLKISYNVQEKKKK